VSKEFTNGARTRFKCGRHRRFSGGVSRAVHTPQSIQLWARFSPLLLVFSFLGATQPLTLTVQIPSAMKIASATAGSTEPKATVQGKVSDHAVVFENLAADSSYDVRLDLADGNVVQGVNLGWYDEEPANPDAGALTDDDRAAIREIIDVPSFYNKSDILAVRGDHARATVLVQLVRDKDFYNGKGEVIWRVELWYFEEDFGGWEKVAQQNQILRRERFKTHDAFQSAVAKLKWAPELGGIVISRDQAPRVVKLDLHR
jgi:hypothetical protein